MKIFKIVNSKIRYKLILGFVIISLFVVVVSYIGFNTTQHVQDDYNIISTKSSPLIHNLESMKFACLRLISSASEYAYIQTESKNKTEASPLEQEGNLVHQSCSSCHKEFHQYQLLAKNSFPELFQNSIEIRDLGNRLHIAALEFMEMKKKNISGDKALDKKEEMEVDEMRFLEVVNKTIAHTNKVLAKQNTEMEDAISSSFTYIIIFDGLAILLSLLFGFSYSRSISKPLTTLTKQLDYFSKGNMDCVIDVKSADEIGDLGNSFNEMARKTKHLILQLDEEIKLTKLSEEKAKTYTERLKTILEVAGEGILGLNIEGDITFANPMASVFLGYKVEELLGKNSHTFFHNYYQDGTLYPEKKSPIYETLHSGKYHTGEENLWKKGFKPFPAEFSSLPIIENDTIAGAVLTFRDISERKRAELERQVLFEITSGITATSNLDDLLKLTNESLKKVIYADNCFIALYDQRTNLFNFPYWVNKFDPMPEPVAMKKSLSSYVFRTGKPFLFKQEVYNQLLEQNEVELVGSDSPSWIGVPLKIPERTIGVLVLQHYEEENVYSGDDVEFLNSVGIQIALAIESKKTEQQILNLNAQLMETNFEKDKFFSIIAHDLRSPFNGFINLTKMISEDIYGFSTDELVTLTNKMSQAAQNLFNLLQNLLEWSQFQKGSISFTPQLLSLSTIVSKCIEQINQTVIQKGIIIINEVSENQEIIADEIMSNSILSNLLSNSVKFTRRDGTVTIRAKNTEDQMVEISLKDTGIGMPKSVMEKLFMIGEKTSRKGTDGELSTGLGLLLCKEFVEKNGGRIWVDSEEGKGSTFYFTLPSSRR